MIDRLFRKISRSFGYEEKLKKSGIRIYFHNKRKAKIYTKKLSKGINQVMIIRPSVIGKQRPYGIITNGDRVWSTGKDSYKVINCSEKCFCENHFNREGKMHRLGGEPAYIFVNYIIIKGKIKTPYTTKKWYENGEPHRIDGPAFESGFRGNETRKKWYQRGKLFWEGDLPVVEQKYLKKWCIYNGQKELVGYKQNLIGNIKYTEYTDLDGKLHRLDGPAVIKKDGREEYWMHGIQFSKDVAKFLIKNDPIF